MRQSFTQDIHYIFSMEVGQWVPALIFLSFVGLMGEKAVKGK
jgi:hypothetical protein